MTEQVEKRGRGRPKGRLTEAEYKKRQREEKKKKGENQICLYMSESHVKKIDFIVNSYPRLKNRADVFNWLMSATVDALYNRTKRLFEDIGVDPDNIEPGDKETIDIAMNTLHTIARIGLEEHLGKFEIAMQSIEVNPAVEKKLRTLLDKMQNENMTDEEVMEYMMQNMEKEQASNDKL